MSRYLSLSIATLVTLASFGSALFFVQPASATGCCLITTSKQTTHDRVNLPPTHVSHTVECRVLGSGQTCAPSPSLACTPSAPGREVTSCVTTAESCKPSTIESDSTECTTTEYQEGACGRFASSCSDALKAVSNCTELSGDEATCRLTQNCFYFGNKCLSRFDRQICEGLPREVCGTNIGTKPSTCSWLQQGDNGFCVSAVEADAAGKYTGQSNGWLPDCAYSGTCRSLNDVVLVAINAARTLFQWLGAAAFGFFIYGGVTMIISFGNAEKVQKGRDILIAAVVGMAIAFGAYLLVDFILDTLHVSNVFRAVG